MKGNHQRKCIGLLWKKLRQMGNLRESQCNRQEPFCRHFLCCEHKRGNKMLPEKKVWVKVTSGGKNTGEDTRGITHTQQHPGYQLPHVHKNSFLFHSVAVCVISVTGMSLWSNQRASLKLALGLLCNNEKIKYVGMLKHCGVIGKLKPPGMLCSLHSS